MHKQFFLGLVSIVSILAIVFGFFYLFTYQSDKPPKHIILISIDTLRLDHLGCYGNPKIYTPNIDALSRSCSQFQKCISPMGRTNPSFASLHTGLYPRENSVRTLFRKLPESQVTIAEILRESGFKTAFFNANPMLQPKSGLTQGFDFYCEPTSNNFEKKTPPVKEKLKSNKILEPQKDPIIGKKKKKKKELWLAQVFNASFDVNNRSPQFKFAAEYVSNSAIKYLETINENDRAFLWVHYMDPHWPYEPPSPWNHIHLQPKHSELQHLTRIPMPVVKFDNPMKEQTRNYLRGLYKCEIEYTDHHLGRFLRKMAEKHILEDSLIVFISDHGESLGEHNVYFCHGDVVYSDNIEVPLMLRSKKQIKPGLLKQSVHMTEVMPIIMDLLGQKYEINRSFPHGDSIMFASTGSTSEENPRSYFPGMKGRWQAIMNDRYKLITIPHPEINIWEMYDKLEDPGEKVNLIGYGLDAELELRQKLVRWMQEDEEQTMVKPENIPEDPVLLEQLKNLGYID
ncbi:sulfatase-like hydrolase/transferase [bacterium]|nr:sulfatase-like hydrolase/transferase [bacterium]